MYSYILLFLTMLPVHAFGSQDEKYQQGIFNTILLI